MPKLKIALYTPSFPPKDGGIATVHYNIYHLLKEKYTIEVFVFNDNSTNIDPYFHFAKTPDWFKKIAKLFVNFYFKKFRNEGNLTSTTGILSTLYPIIKLNRKLNHFKPDIIIVSDHYVPGYALHKPKGSKLIWYSHHNYLRFRNNPFFSPNNTADNDISRSMERKALRKADAVICPSNYMIEEYYKAYSHNVPIALIHNFIENKELEKIDYINSFNSGFQVVYIPSAGSAVKGKRYTYEIVRRISKHFDGQVSFYLSGGIPDDLEIELKSIENLNIFMPGKTNWQTNISYLKSCRIGISPTLSENFSAAIIEGNILGIPFITFDVGGNKELVKNDITGYIVPYLDVDAIISKANYLLENEVLCKNFSANAKNWSKELLDPDKITEECDHLFKSLIIE